MSQSTENGLSLDNPVTSLADEKQTPPVDPLHVLAKMKYSKTIVTDVDQGPLRHILYSDQPIKAVAPTWVRLTSRGVLVHETGKDHAPIWLEPGYHKFFNEVEYDYDQGEFYAVFD